MTSLHNYRIGFIGLGLMGKPMCLNLHKAGAQLIVFNRNPQAAKAIEQAGIEIADSPAAVAAQADIIIIMVSDTPAVEQVLFGEQGVIQAVRPGTLVIDMGSSAAKTTREFAQRLARQGVEFVDAPVSGGEIGAINGELTIMAGGTPANIERAMPLFKVMGKAFTHIGEVGAGQVAKAANQIIVGLNIGAVAEALALVKRAGVDQARVREALMNGFAASRILEVHGQKMIDGNFQPGAKSTTQHKDMQQALELADSYDLKLPATTLTLSLYQDLIDAGKGDFDHSALYQLLMARS